ncbi:MAG TPA: hypothetical protein VMW38_06815 [Terriglobia bacterium]|nr:hypothetical protein [Terriglobia bacterium]
MKVPHDSFKVTTADENGGLGGSVGADHGTAVPRAATVQVKTIAARRAAPTFKAAFS